MSGAALILTGQTATGKTELSMQLADRLPVDLISVDSAMVYRGLDIGTNKPSPQLLAHYPHALIDIREPCTPYSAGAFQGDATDAITAAWRRGRLPVLVGGTMLYFKTLLDGMAKLPATVPHIRKDILAEAHTKGWAWMHRQLENVDPVSANRLRPTDTQRVMRALEVFRISGVPLTTHWRRNSSRPGLACPSVQFAIPLLSREELRERIARRFRSMLHLGLVDEVARLRSRGDLSPQLPAMRAIGYRQAWAYLDGRISRSDLETQGILTTWQMARRQRTWLRKWTNLRWLPEARPQGLEVLLRAAHALLEDATNKAS